MCASGAGFIEVLFADQSFVFWGFLLGIGGLGLEGRSLLDQSLCDCLAMDRWGRIDVVVAGVSPNPAVEVWRLRFLNFDC